MEMINRNEQVLVSQTGREIMARKSKSGGGDGCIRKNITLPASFESRLERLRTFTGTASDSELIRTALTKLEEIMDKAEASKK